MSARIPPARFGCPIALPALWMFLAVAPAVADSVESRETRGCAETTTSDKTDTARKSSPASRPTDNAGAVSQALQELYRIPRPAAGPRAVGPASRNARSAQSQPHANDLVPHRFGFTGRAEAPRRAVVENAAPKRGVYTNDRYETPQGTPDEQYAEENLEPSRFGFVRGRQSADWAARASARGESLLSSSSSYLGRGLAAFRAGQYRMAAKHFKMAHENNLGDPSAMIYSAHAFFAIGRYQDAANFLRKAFTLEPRIALLDYDIRDDYGNKADFELHMRALNNAIVSAPRDLDRLTFLGYALLYSDQPDRAFEVLTRARSIAPQDKLVALLYDSTLPPDPATPAGHHEKKAN